MTSRPLLQVEGLEAAYRSSQVLFGVDLEVSSGTVTALLGRNGMGKTTTVRSLFGLTRRLGGTVRFADIDLAPLPPHRIARLGIGLVPEGRQIFPNLSVREQLLATARPAPAREATWTLEQVLDLLPRLRDRLRHGGAQLSGGEQQMLAIGRALLTNPRLLILDEATEGLAPNLCDAIWTCLAQLKANGLSILVIDPDLDRLNGFADRSVILENGRTAWWGPTAALAADPSIAERLLAV